MSKNKKKKRSFLIIIILVIACIGIYFLVFNKKDTNEIVSKIDNYDYFISENDTELTKKLYEELKETLNDESIDYEKYAKLISQLFIADLYTMSNKNSKYAVNSKIYFYPEYRDNFSLKVKQTIYNYLGSLEKKPEVINTEILNINSASYNINDKTYEGYDVQLKWDYRDNLNYDNHGKIGIIKDNNKLFIVSYTGGDEK